MTTSDPNDSLVEATLRCRAAFVALVVAEFGDTLLPEVLEVLRANNDSGDREAATIRRSRPTTHTDYRRRLEEAEAMFVGFLDAFAGRRITVPSTQVLTGVIREAGVFHEVVVEKRSPRDVAARRGMSAKCVSDIAERVGAIVEAVAGGKR